MMNDIIVNLHCSKCKKIFEYDGEFSCLYCGNNETQVVFKIDSYLIKENPEKIKELLSEKIDFIFAT